MKSGCLHYVFGEQDRIASAEGFGLFLGDVEACLARTSIASAGVTIDVIHSFNAVQLPTREGPRFAIYLGSEEGHIPAALLDHYDVIFANYAGAAKKDPRHRAQVHPFPLGFYAGRRVGLLKPLAERTYDFCFIGTVNVHRLGLLAQFAEPSIARALYQVVHVIRDLPKTEHATEFLKRRVGVPRVRTPARYFLHFGDQWSKGIAPAEYERVLANSRVVACPRGWSSTETFRHYEAALAGCVIMTERLPRTYFYEGAPFVEVRDWSNIGPRVEAIQAQIRSGAVSDRQSRDFYEAHMSPAAAAAHIAQVISKS